jgi:hypothetical protein
MYLVCHQCTALFREYPDLNELHNRRCDSIVERIRYGEPVHFDGVLVQSPRECSPC